MSDDITEFAGKSTPALQARLTELRDQIRERSDEARRIKQALAERAATVRVGDRVTWQGGSDVWEITAIRPGFGNDPKYFGKKIKKDGTPGVRIVEMWRAYGKDLILVEANNER